MNNRFVPKFTIGFKRFKNEFWNAICKRFKPIVNFGKRPKSKLQVHNLLGMVFGICSPFGIRLPYPNKTCYDQVTFIAIRICKICKFQIG
jgi:hypothetical protein